MVTYILRRLLWAAFLVLVVSFLTFVIFYALPTGDPAVLRAGARSGNQALLESIRETLGLEQPWYVQYAKYMERLLLHFDLGFSYRSDAPVREQIFDRIPATASLVLGAAVLWVAVGIPVGVVSATRRRSWIDRIAMGAALVAISAPVYWLGLVVLYLFAQDIGRFPLFKGSGSYVGLTESPAGWFGSLLLPWCVLAATAAAFYARLLRGNLRAVLSEDYIRTARAKGLPERVVVWRHGVRSAITPVVTVLGLDIGILLGGAILTETVFNIPGVGRLAFTAIRSADLPVIQGTVLFGALFIIVANLVVDVLYAFLDPRVRFR
jgi:peptide/nickel transport system permease protein